MDFLAAYLRQDPHHPRNKPHQSLLKSDAAVMPEAVLGASER